MPNRSFAAFGLALWIATGAAAQTQTDASHEKPAKEKKVCRRDVSTGSIMPQTTCHTKAEWAQIDQQNQAGVDSFAASRQNSIGHR